MQTGQLTRLSLILGALANLGLGPSAPGDPAPPSSVGGGRFSLVVIPDTQAYSENYDLSPTSTSTGHRYIQRFHDQTRWIVDHAALFNIRFVSHVGDVVQNFNLNNASEWAVARKAMNRLHPSHDPKLAPYVPYAVSLGNHDFDSPSPSNLDATKFASQYGPGRFKNAQGQFHPFYKGSDLGWNYVVNGTIVETGKGLNSYQRFKGGGYSFLHLTLQCAPTNGSIAWAKQILAAHPGKRTILTTHAFIDGGAESYNLPGKFLSASNMGRLKPGVTNDAAGLWNKLIRQHDQIFMVLCGHASEQEHIVLRNDFDHPVLVYEASYTINTYGGRITMADQQGQPWLYQGPDDDDRNGSGWLGLLVFDPHAQHVTWYTYSPTLGIWAKDKDPQSYPPAMTTYPWGSDVIVRTRLDLDDPTRFAP